MSRRVREYTDPALTDRFGELDKESVAALKCLPCIFAYENARELPPKFGRMIEIIRRQNMVRLEYRIEPVAPFLSDEDC